VNSSNKNKIVLITGATGAVGPGVVYALHQAGYQIRSFSIDHPSAGLFPQSVEIVVGDITDQVAVQSAMQGVDAVVHLAALLHIDNQSSGMREKYEHVNIGGTSTVVDAAIKAGVTRVVLFSTIAVYGHTEGCVLNEMSPTNPETFYAQTKLAAEKIVLNAISTGGQPFGTVLRFGAIYGSRIKGNYERLTHALASHRFIPIGSGLNRRTLIYDNDVGRAAALAVAHPITAGRIFNVTDGGYHTMKEITKSICSALGRRPPRLSLPVGPVRIVAGLIEKVANIIGLRSPVTFEAINKYTEDIAVDGSLIQQELGFVPQYNLITGWKETIKNMRGEKRLKS